MCAPTPLRHHPLQCRLLQGGAEQAGAAPHLLEGACLGVWRKREPLGVVGNPVELQRCAVVEVRAGGCENEHPAGHRLLCWGRGACGRCCRTCMCMMQNSHHSHSSSGPAGSCVSVVMRYWSNSGVHPGLCGMLRNSADPSGVPLASNSIPAEVPASNLPAFTDTVFCCTDQHC